MPAVRAALSSQVEELQGDLGSAKRRCALAARFARFLAQFCSHFAHFSHVLRSIRKLEKERDLALSALVSIHKQSAVAWV